MCHWWLLSSFVACVFLSRFTRNDVNVTDVHSDRVSARSRAFLIQSRIQAKVETTNYFEKVYPHRWRRPQKWSHIFSTTIFLCSFRERWFVCSFTFFTHNVNERIYASHEKSTRNARRHTRKINGKCKQEPRSVTHCSLVTHSVVDHLNYNNRVCSNFVNEQRATEWKEKTQRERKSEKSNAAHKASENEERARCSYQRDNWQRVS